MDKAELCLWVDASEDFYWQAVRSVSLKDTEKAICK